MKKIIVNIFCFVTMQIFCTQTLQAIPWINIDHIIAGCDSLGSPSIQIFAKKNSGQISSFSIFDESGTLLFSSLTPLNVTPQTSQRNAQYFLNGNILSNGRRYCIVGNRLSTATDTVCFTARFNNCISTPQSLNCDYIQNSNFDIGMTNRDQENIHDAIGWTPIWDKPIGASTGDFKILSNQRFAGFCLENSSANYKREGIMNTLINTIPFGNQEYTLSFKMRKTDDIRLWGNPILNIYGINSNTLGVWPANTTVMNSSIFPSNSTLRLLGSIPVTSTNVANEFQSYQIVFQGSDLSSSGINRIFFTRADNSGGGIYINIDSVVVCRNLNVANMCCKNKLKMWGDVLIPPSEKTPKYTHAWDILDIREASDMNISEIICNVESVEYFNSHNQASNPSLLTPLSDGSIFGESTISGMVQSTPMYTLLYPQNRNYHRIAWKSDNLAFGTSIGVGNQIKIHYLLPRVSQKVRKAKVCMRITIRDIECNVCEIYTCSDISLK